VPNKFTPNRIRADFPTVDYLPATENFWIDARQFDYPGKKSGQYKFKDRDKALAKAEEIAALVADTQSTAPNLPSSVLAKLTAAPPRSLSSARHTPSSSNSRKARTSNPAQNGPSSSGSTTS
jgi:hypothetical protein